MQSATYDFEGRFCAYSGVNFPEESVLIDNKIVRRDGEFHPHPTAELIRRRIAEGEVYQSLSRARAVNRTADTPLDIYVLTDVSLSIPIDEEIDAGEVLNPSPVDLMLAEGGVAFESPTTASLSYPEIWKTAEAAKKKFSGVNEVRVQQGRSPIENFIWRSAPLDPHLINLGKLVIRRPGVPTEECVFIDNRRVAVARAAIEALIGPVLYVRDPNATGPIAKMLAERGIAFTNAASAATAFPHFWKTTNAAKMALRKHETVFDTTVRHVVIQRKGPGCRPETVYALPHITRADIEAALGQKLAKYAVQREPFPLLRFGVKLPNTPPLTPRPLVLGQPFKPANAGSGSVPNVVKLGVWRIDERPPLSAFGRAAC